MYISQWRCLFTHLFIHTFSHARSSLNCNSSMAFTAMKPPIGNSLIASTHCLISTHWVLYIAWKFRNWLLHVGLVGFELPPLDKHLYYNVNSSDLDSIAYLSYYLSLETLVTYKEAIKCFSNPNNLISYVPSTTRLRCQHYPFHKMQPS